MPQRCGVPGCNSNSSKYFRNGKPYASIFSLPKDEELRRKWIASIHRHRVCFDPTECSTICARHFNESDVVRIDRAERLDGTIIECPRKYPKLKRNAVPSIFPDPPSYVTFRPSKKVINANIKREELFDSDQDNFEEYMPVNPPKKRKNIDKIKQELFDRDQDNFQEYVTVILPKKQKNTNRRRLELFNRDQDKFKECVTVNPPKKRKNTDIRRQELFDPDQDNFNMTVNRSKKRKNPDIKKELSDQDQNKSDQINSFEKFLEDFQTRNLHDFLFKITDKLILFFKVNLNDVPKIICSFKVHKDLTVQVYHNDLLIPISKFSWILGKENICSSWSAFDSLVSHLDHLNEKKSDSSIVCIRDKRFSIKPFSFVLL